MNAADLNALRAFLEQCLREAGDTGEFADSEALFSSGRLDSLALTRVVLFLEEKFGIDFGALDFSADLIDSVADIQALLAQRSLKPA